MGGRCRVFRLGGSRFLWIVYLYLKSELTIHLGLKLIVFECLFFASWAFIFSKLGKYVRTFFPWEVTQQRHDISSIPGIS
jgi:hypothetical protein